MFDETPNGSRKAPPGSRKVSTMSPNTCSPCLGFKHAAEPGVAVGDQESPRSGRERFELSFSRCTRFYRRLRRLAFLMIIFTGFRCAPPGAKFFEPAPQAQGLSRYTFFALRYTGRSPTVMSRSREGAGDDKNTEDGDENTR